MPAKVTLTITQGEPGFVGKVYSYNERTTCIIGRDPECDPQIPDDEAHWIISRYHCLLDINPPDARVRDFGSLNGTYVNGQKIGQRDPNQSVEEAVQVNYPEHDLKDGDEIQLGQTVFRVGILAPTLCSECSKEIPESNVQRCKRGGGICICEVCWQKMRKAKAPKPILRRKVCVKCGRNVSNEIAPNRQGKYICLTCRRSDVEGIMRMLLMGAKQGRPELRAIKGYTLLGKLGRGGMGEVHLAKQEKTGQQVALKVMLPEGNVNPRARDVFLREVDITAAMSHKNIVKLFDSGCSDGTFFFTLDYCDGGNVEELMLKRGGKLSIDEACQITLQALDGLKYAHNVELHVKLRDGSFKDVHGIVHRDIKPANIFLCGSGKSAVAKIADFGLGKAFDTAGLSGQTRTGAKAGTPCFTPRQQVVTFKYSKPEVDVWAMAASLYHMLCGIEKSPKLHGPGIFPRNFPPGSDPWRVVLSTNAVSISIRRRNPSIPKKLADVIDAALVDSPDISFKTAAEFKKVLEDAL